MPNSKNGYHIFLQDHKIKANLPLWAEFEILRNGALKEGKYV